MRILYDYVQRENQCLNYRGAGNQFTLQGVYKNMYTCNFCKKKAVAAIVIINGSSVTLSDLAKYSMTRNSARPLCDSWASCLRITGQGI